ncbi:MAG: DUF885 domain-containing protein [Gemmatimonadales bacterium]
MREPKAPAEFRRLNPRLEAASTYGFYQPPSPASPVGIYFYNASNLKERNLASVGTIAFHELVPGHHFQIALALENDSLPPFRREFNANAFAEGWAEYASSLAGELGMYSDPYDAYGRLISEAFLTTRLVVDPGMNLLGWSRDSAMASAVAHTMMAESEIRSETLRYAVDLPGQALGYKVGAMEFHRLRRHAAEALGDRFDVRAFHALVLDAGSLPMAVVERMVDRWIERVRSGGLSPGGITFTGCRVRPRRRGSAPMPTSGGRSTSSVVLGLAAVVLVVVAVQKRDQIAAFVLQSGDVTVTGDAAKGRPEADLAVEFLTAFRANDMSNIELLATPEVLVRLRKEAFQPTDAFRVATAAMLGGLPAEPAALRNAVKSVHVHRDRGVVTFTTTAGTWLVTLDRGDGSWKVLDF